MNNKSIGYWDGYLSKEAEDSTGGWEESLAELNKVEGLNAAQAAARREELQKQLEDDFFYGVTAEESKRKFGAAGAGAGLGAVLGGLMGGTRGAAVGGIMGSLLGFVGQAMGLIPEDTWEWLMKWRKEGKVGGEVKKLWGKRKARLAAEAAEGTPPVTPEGTSPVTPEAPLVNPPSGGQGDPNRRWGDDTTIKTIVGGDNGNAATNGINAHVRAAAAAGTSDEAQAQADLKQATDVANEAGVGESVKTHAAKFTVSNQIVTGDTQGTHTIPGGTKATAVAAATPDPAVSPEKRFGAKYDPQQGWLDSRLTEEDFRSIAKHEGADAARSSAMSNVVYWNQVANENPNDLLTQVPLSVVDTKVPGMSDELHGKLKARFTWQQMNSPFKGVAAPGTPEREAHNAKIQQQLNKRWYPGVDMDVSREEFNQDVANEHYRQGWDSAYKKRHEEALDLVGRGPKPPTSTSSDNEVKIVTGPTHDSRGNKMIQEVTSRGVLSRPKVIEQHRTPETPKVPPPREQVPKVQPPNPKITSRGTPRNKRVVDTTSPFSGGGPLWNRYSNQKISSQVLNMPWYAAQKLAGPGQIQQVPVEPAQQAPTEKDVFDQEAKEVDHKAKMEDYKMQMGLIGAKTQAGQAAADQATQTSQAKATEAAQPAAGTGQYTAGANPSTVGANPSTVGANPSTVGTEQSTVGTEQSTAGTESTARAGSMSMDQPMPEAQWAGPTTA